MADWIQGGEPSGKVPDTVWLGVSVENQAVADERIPILLSIPAKVRFLSIEPMLGPIDLTSISWNGWFWNALTGECRYCGVSSGQDNRANHVDWVIVGGESGPQARPFDLGWARSIRDQCQGTGVAFFMKQMGSRPEPREWWDESSTPHVRRIIRDPKGGDPSEWPEDLRVREFPR